VTISHRLEESSNHYKFSDDEDTDGTTGRPPQGSSTASNRQEEDAPTTEQPLERTDTLLADSVPLQARRITSELPRPTRSDRYDPGSSALQEDKAPRSGLTASSIRSNKRPAEDEAEDQGPGKLQKSAASREQVCWSRCFERSR